MGACPLNQIDRKALLFPPAFRFGAATAAHQVEGGTSANQWTRWEIGGRPDERPGITGGQRCGNACDHWNRFEADLELMEALGLRMYRFSVEWSRIEPVEGYVDSAALDRYRQWCVLLRAAGIEPMVTLHHFTEPIWFTDLGGFENPDTMRCWVRFVERVVTALADVVDLWVTVNEPTGYAVQGWWLGNWPPGVIDAGRAGAVLRRLLTAHAQAFHAIRRVDQADADGDGIPARIGLAHHIVPFRPRLAWSPADRLAARLLHQAYNVAVPRALTTGRLTLRVPGVVDVQSDDSLWRGTLDWLGVNAYYPLHAAASARPPYITAGFTGRGAVNDLGWDLDPNTLSWAVRFASRYRLPLIVTEHGTCDADNPDERRRRFLTESLAALNRCLADGIAVEAYLHWSLLDNFEWAEGFTPRFGIFAVDYTTFERRWTSSAHRYRDIIEFNTAPRGGRVGHEP